ncbi:ATP-binding cassette domain-containing protein [Streptomyces afghaniensis]|uniref:ATP-binding cassette domain-containing protein n=1 Tax=Streptomyces afghaniensis TaxID=66865 RepID=UPI003787C4F8
MTTLTLPARDRAQLICAGVRVDRGGRTVLHDVGMKVSPGARWGVVGENGRGKSTLLHVLAGLLTPDAGTVHRVGTLALAEQEMPAGDERTVGDFIDEYLTDARAALRDLDAAAEALAAERPGAEQAYADAPRDAGKPVAELSTGQQRRLDLALALAARPHVLLLDEPTNHLSIALVDELTEALHSAEAAVVLATHDRQMRRDIADWPHLAPARHRPALPGGVGAGAS